jgi:hypothetical protein
MRMDVQVGTDLGSQLVELDSGGVLLAPFSATFTSDRLRVAITVDVADGVPICRSYSAERTDGGGLELMTTEVMRGLPLRSLMADACAASALEVEQGARGYSPATSVEAIEAVLKTLRRRRTPTTDKELREFAAAYRKDFVRGRMAEFAESLGYSERHAYRLLRLARERGLLPEKETH